MDFNQPERSIIFKERIPIEKIKEMKEISLEKTGMTFLNDNEEGNDIYDTLLHYKNMPYIGYSNSDHDIDEIGYANVTDKNYNDNELKSYHSNLDEIANLMSKKFNVDFDIKIR